MPVRAVLWDADGVLQQTPPGTWRAATAVVREFPGYLTGARVDAQRILAVVESQGLAARGEEILRVWSTFDVLPASLEVVAAVRSAGTPCFLATNQDLYRAGFMRSLTVYDDQLDGCYYSCDLGIAKPDPEFFEHIAGDLGLAASELLFIDDQPENVESARDVGLAAELWHHSQGIDALTGRLATHRVRI